MSNRRTKKGHIWHASGHGAVVLWPAIDRTVLEWVDLCRMQCELLFKLGEVSEPQWLEDAQSQLDESQRLLDRLKKGALPPKVKP